MNHHTGIGKTGFLAVIDNFYRHKLGRRSRRGCHNAIEQEYSRVDALRFRSFEPDRIAISGKRAFPSGAVSAIEFQA